MRGEGEGGGGGGRVRGLVEGCERRDLILSAVAFRNGMICDGVILCSIVPCFVTWYFWYDMISCDVMIPMLLYDTGTIVFFII